MAMGPFSPIFSLIPFILVISLSFFILVVISNVKVQALKIFGYVIVALCWFTAILIFSTCVCKQMRGMCPGMPTKRGMMDRSKGMQEAPVMPKGQSCPKMQSK
ncbi:MAG: hypothetical protein WC412_02830 [Candidatus Omnitrophota bacterium]|jgi:hypothetical protein